MTQELKDKALDILKRCTIEANKIRLPEEEIDHEVWTIVKDALVEGAHCQYNKRTKLFVVAIPSQALVDAELWIESLDVVTYEAPVLYDGPETIEPEVEEEPVEQEQPENLQFKKERRTLRYDFTAEETHELALKLAEENRKLASVKEEKSAATAQFGARLKKIEATLAELSMLITNGYEHRDVECEIYYNKPEPGKKTIIRTDTKTSRIEKMEPWEFNLFTQPADDTYEEELAR